MAKGVDETTETVKIALVGKYNGLSDAYLSVLKALTHSGHPPACEGRRRLGGLQLPGERASADKPEAYAEAWKTLKAAAGVLVPGGFGHRGGGQDPRCALLPRE